MRVEGAQSVNGLMRVQVVCKEEDSERRLVATEVFDRETVSVRIVCDTLPAGGPVSEEDELVLGAIMRALTSDYVFGNKSKVKDDQEQKEKENEPERVRKD